MRFTAAVLVSALVTGVVFRARAQTSPGPRAGAAPAAPSAAESPAPKPRVELTDEAELAKVVSLYEAGKYAECSNALRPLLDPKSRQRLRERDVVESARIYLAACLIGSGKSDAADEPLRQAIRDNMQMKPPDSLLFPPPVVERFLQVRQSLYDEIRRAEDERLNKARREAERRLERERAEVERVRELETLATRELVIIRNRRWIGFVPFGVGQFQNGNEGLGWVFLTSQSVLGATALTSLGVWTHFHARAAELDNQENDAVVRTWYTLFEVSSLSFLGVAALGVLEAQLSFVPEIRERRVRPLPPRLRRSAAAPSLQPNFGASGDGVFLGLSGRF